MPDRSFRYLIYTLAIVGLLVDQATKYGVFAWLAPHRPHAFAVFQTEPAGSERFFAMVPPEEEEIVRAHQHRGFFLEVAFTTTDKDGVGLTPHVNQGALFGLFRDQGEMANRGFALISLLAAIGIGLWSLHSGTAADRWLCCSLGLILAGTLGNLYDRVVFSGVRDFLHWHYKFDWPVFNMADVCLVCGAGMLLLQAFFAPQTEPTKEAPPQQEKVIAPVGTPAAVTTGQAAN
jgi:lipoprotein signal peptidase